MNEDEMLEAAERWRSQISDIKKKKLLRAGIRDSKDIKAILKPIKKEIKKAERNPISDWNELWQSIVGDEIGAATEVQSLKEGILTIHVNNSVLRTELQAFYTDDLLAAIKEAKSNNKVIRGIKFKS